MLRRSSDYDHELSTLTHVLFALRALADRRRLPLESLALREQLAALRRSVGHQGRSLTAIRARLRSSWTLAASAWRPRVRDTRREMPGSRISSSAAMASYHERSTGTSKPITSQSCATYARGPPLPSTSFVTSPNVTPSFMSTSDVIIHVDPPPVPITPSLGTSRTASAWPKPPYITVELTDSHICTTIKLH